MATIYGECVCGTTRASVTISQLNPERCTLALAGGDGLHGELELWIGAIGPFGITAEQADARSLTAHFNTPLEHEIIEHFNA
jgi:hypothetical protein